MVTAKKLAFAAAVAMLVGSGANAAVIDVTAGDAASLQAAVVTADAAGGINTINVPAGTYLLTATLTTSNPANSLSIVGTGAPGTVILDGQNARTVFSLSGGTVSLGNLVIQHGKPATISTGVCTGAGILMFGTTVVNLTSSTVQLNSATDVGGTHSGSGGGICVF